jgi:hypothetical protein
MKLVNEHAIPSRVEFVHLENRWLPLVFACCAPFLSLRRHALCVVSNRQVLEMVLRAARDKRWTMRLWQVTRFCCLSGMCFDCRAIVTGGSRKRIVVVENVTEEAAVRIVRTWVEYGAEASEMPEAEHVIDRSVAPVSFPPDSVLTDTIRSSALTSPRDGC